MEMIGNNSYYRPLVVWLFTGCILVALMVVIGGITRLTYSGLSIVNWNVIMGTLPPLNESQWHETFELYKQSPEFQKRNYHFELDDFKSIFWWEYIHRFTGRLMGLVFIFGFVYFLVTKRITRAMIPLFVLLFLLGIMQGVIGWWMVVTRGIPVRATSSRP